MSSRLSTIYTSTGHSKKIQKIPEISETTAKFLEQNKLLKKNLKNQQKLQKLLFSEHFDRAASFWVDLVICKLPKSVMGFPKSNPRSPAFNQKRLLAIHQRNPSKYNKVLFPEGPHHSLWNTFPPTKLCLSIRMLIALSMEVLHSLKTNKCYLLWNWKKEFTNVSCFNKELIVQVSYFLSVYQTKLWRKKPSIVPPCHILMLLPVKSSTF